MMGEVWLAHDPQLDRDVAIKLLPASFAKDEERLRRFLREARATARLDHPHVVTVHQAGTDGERAFIAMQYVDGGSLDKAVAASGPLDWREATQVIREAAAGLSAAHALGMVHRDVKPANLMRTTTGVTKVVDFGLVRAEAGDSHLTQDGRLLGTPAYMAPEQWTGEQVDARSDLYSLVCTYYYLLTGRVPFDAPTAPSLGYQHRYESPPDPREACGPTAGRRVSHSWSRHVEGPGPAVSDCRRVDGGLGRRAGRAAGVVDVPSSLAPALESLWDRGSSCSGDDDKTSGDNRRIVFWNVMVAAISFLVLVVVLAVIFRPRKPDGSKDDAAGRKSPDTGGRSRIKPSHRSPTAASVPDCVAAHLVSREISPTALA